MTVADMDIADEDTENADWHTTHSDANDRMVKCHLNYHLRCCSLMRSTVYEKGIRVGHTEADFEHTLRCMGGP